ncbi:uncharacterized protein TNCV_3669601 [Trichonephila clavipes]|nr:uncharacterized protein TNCV_3669601 [Trichonephila clavipes]
MSVLEAKTTTIAAISGMYNTRHYESTLQQGFRYRVFLATKSRTNWGREPAMEESKKDVGSLEQLLLYADEHYLARKLPLGDHLGNVLHGVEEYHQRNVGPVRFHASQLKWTGYHRL